VVDVDGRRFVTAAISLASAGRDWSVLIVVPEDEFAGSMASSNRNALVMSLAVIGIAALLATLLIRQFLVMPGRVKLSPRRFRCRARFRQAFHATVFA
jgi:hypothetical protein